MSLAETVIGSAVGGGVESVGEVVMYGIANALGFPLPHGQHGPTGHGSSANEDEKLRWSMLRAHARRLVEMTASLIQSEIWTTPEGGKELSTLRKHWRQVREEQEAATHGTKSPHLVEGELVQILLYTATRRCVSPFTTWEEETIVKESLPAPKEESTDDSAKGEQGSSDKRGRKQKSGKKDGAQATTTTTRLKLPTFTDDDLKKLRGRIREFLLELDGLATYEDFISYVDGLKVDWFEAKGERIAVEAHVRANQLKALDEEWANKIPLISNPNEGGGYVVEKFVVASLVTFITLAMVGVNWIVALVTVFLTLAIYHRRMSLSKRLSRWHKEMRAAAPKLGTALGDALRSAFARSPIPITDEARARKKRNRVIVILFAFVAAIALAYVLTHNN